MTNIVLLCYGNAVEYKRAILSILSLLSWGKAESSSHRFLCFTDNPGYFERYLPGVHVEYILLTDSSLDEMAGENRYIHRRKICILEETYALYPEGHIVFLDSDTFFFDDSTNCLNQLEYGISLMHEKEYRLEEAPDVYKRYMNHRIPDAPKYPLSFLELIQKHKFIAGGEEIYLDEKNYIWNSGVIGMHNASLPFLRDILSFCDTTYLETKWFISEQLAFCLVLQSQTELLPASNAINHYHRHKALMDQLIAGLMTESFSKMTLEDKLPTVREFTFKANKLLSLDLAVSIASGELKNKNYLNTAKCIYRALKMVTLDGMLLTFVKGKIRKAKSLL